LDTLSLCGYVYGKDMRLTQKEYSVLLLLMQNAGKAVSSAEITREIWGADTESNNRALWTMISRLRKKLESDCTRLEISAQRGGGYILEQI
jgi:two-component system response regulator ArlR